MRHQLALVDGEHPQQVELVRRQVNRRSGHANLVLLEVDLELPDRDQRLARRSGPAQDGAQAGDQLVDPDRLRHVVVGSRVERGDLLALVADRREHDHGRRAPRAELAHDVGPGSVREDEIEDDGLGRPHRRRRQGMLGGLGRLHVEPGPSQARAQRPEDLLLVVHHEDAGRAHASTAVSGAGSASTNVAP